MSSRPTQAADAKNAAADFEPPECSIMDCEREAYAATMEPVQIPFCNEHKEVKQAVEQMDEIQ